MNKDQKLTPKYWVGHNTEKDDVFLWTADKNRGAACQYMVDAFGEVWFLDETFEVSLVEIKLVEP